MVLVMISVTLIRDLAHLQRPPSRTILHYHFQTKSHLIKRHRKLGMKSVKSMIMTSIQFMA
jgi:hypothetical protein